jgi:hypothetical protein
MKLASLALQLQLTTSFDDEAFSDVVVSSPCRLFVLARVPCLVRRHCRAPRAAGVAPDPVSPGLARTRCRAPAAVPARPPTRAPSQDRPGGRRTRLGPLDPPTTFCCVRTRPTDFAADKCCARTTAGRPRAPRPHVSGGCWVGGQKKRRARSTPPSPRRRWPRASDDRPRAGALFSHSGARVASPCASVRPELLPAD